MVCSIQYEDFYPHLYPVEYVSLLHRVSPPPLKGEGNLKSIPSNYTLSPLGRGMG
jgi:hypothetical protein